MTKRMLAEGGRTQRGRRGRSGLGNKKLAFGRGGKGWRPAQEPDEGDGQKRRLDNAEERSL